MVGVFPKLGPSRHPDHEMVTKVDQTNVANSRWTRREHASWLRGTRHVEYFETIVYSPSTLCSCKLAYQCQTIPTV
jgi:hypothetical protein